MKIVTDKDTIEFFALIEFEGSVVDAVGRAEDVLVDFCKSQWPAEVTLTGDAYEDMCACEALVVSKFTNDGDYTALWNFNKHINEGFWACFDWIRRENTLLNQQP